ncbi:hypothetical protein Cgig2_006097 [Carnegiea gigantea]|uniref:Heparanase-like protein 1 n=1 Tax=Carnegiea gigantea TaxID=171969 RepID=A0A9Q1QRX8_9CARY|nr:hypothetical protein Cgig2_006097 [Carnegiea gigantea]
MESQLLLCILLACLPLMIAQDSAIISIDGTHNIANIDENFVCATLDWWPPDKCDFGQCQWGNTSILNLNLSHPFLAKAVQAFRHLRIRLGGSLEDQVLYGVSSLKIPCLPFHKDPNGLFGFSSGCLQMDRWDSLNDFFNKTGAIITFGLNALYGRQKTPATAWIGRWDSSNARDFMDYTISKGYPIDSWEFGNELSGQGIGASVDAAQYGKDLINLRGIIDELYKNSSSKALLLAPGGFFDEEWFTQLIQASGPGNDTDSVVQHILDPEYASDMLDDIFGVLNETVQQYGPWASVWVSEAGGAYSSGDPFVSNTFLNSFWYLDQLGTAAVYNTKVYCRQTLIGGNYGLLDKITFVPNPDYYSALLWSRLMGKKVLPTYTEASSYLRAYAHCTKRREGVTLLLINLSNSTTYEIKIHNTMNRALHVPNYSVPKQGYFKRKFKKAFSWAGSKASRQQLYREEYRLTPKGNFKQSQIVLLNGKQLSVSEKGEIPHLEPAFVNAFSPIHISPLSIIFIVLPKFEAPTCLS